MRISPNSQMPFIIDDRAMRVSLPSQLLTTLMLHQCYSRWCHRMENYQNLTRRDWQAIEIFPNHYLCPLFKSWHQAEYVVIYQARICLESPHVISIAVEYLGVWNERVFWELLAIERQKEQQKTLMREEKNHQIVKSMPTLLNALDTAQRVQFLVILLGVILAAIASL